MLFLWLIGGAKSRRHSTTSCDRRPDRISSPEKHNTQQSRKTNWRGFSLVELLVATAILAVGILGALQLFPQNYDEIGTAGRISIMNHLAQQKLDQLKTLSYTASDLTAGVHGSPNPERVTYISPSGNNVFENYTIRWEVRDDKPQERMKTVIVEVGHQLFDSSNNPIASSQALNQEVVRYQAYISR